MKFIKITILGLLTSGIPLLPAGLEIVNLTDTEIRVPFKTFGWWGEANEQFHSIGQGRSDSFKKLGVGFKNIIIEVPSGIRGRAFSEADPKKIRVIDLVSRSPFMPWDPNIANIYTYDQFKGFTIEPGQGYDTGTMGETNPVSIAEGIARDTAINKKYYIFDSNNLEKAIDQLKKEYEDRIIFKRDGHEVDTHTLSYRKGDKYYDPITDEIKK